MNKEDFSLWVTSAKGRLYHIACSYLRGEHDRLDAISEAVAKAWQKRASLKNEQYFDTWLARILIHECINVQRKQKRIFPVREIPEGEEQLPQTHDLQWAVDALPQKLRIAVVLHYLEGYSVDEMARTLRLPKGTVCSHLSQARSALRGLLEEEIE